MTAVLPARAIRRARLATFAFFILNGFLLGMWLVHIPVVKDRVGASVPVLGWLLLLLGVGAFVGMQVGGWCSDRFGSSRVVLLGAAVNSLAVLGPGLATSVPTLAAALLVFGLTNGLIDVSMNTHAVEVERHYDRPIMASFHAYWSIGGLLAAITGGAMISAGVPLTVTFGGAVVLGLAVTLVCRTSVLAGTSPTMADTAEVADSAALPRRTARWSGRVLALGALAFILMLSEGVANDWSTVHLNETLGTSKATAAWAYGLFAAAMTTGRFATDRIVHVVGPPAFVRAGALIAAAGLATTALAPHVAVALVGWTVTGIGLSGCVPQFFSAAGNVDQDASGTNLARVAGLGYLGLLAGPAIIGGLNHWMDLPRTFWLPTAGCLVAGLVAARLLSRPSASAPPR